MSIKPTTINEAIALAQALSKSNMIPREYQSNPANILVAIQWGMEVGLAPMQALQNLTAINGRLCLWGDSMLALVKASGLLESIEEKVEDGVATCVVKRKNENVHTEQFTMDDARQAGLLNKGGPWKTYPKRMLILRARGWALRNVFPDVLKGVVSAEEAIDIPVQVDTPVQTPVQAPVQAPSPVLARVLQSIDQANSIEQLEGTVPEAKTLPEHELGKARLAFGKKLKELRKEI